MKPSQQDAFSLAKFHSLGPQLLTYIRSNHAISMVSLWNREGQNVKELATLSNPTVDTRRPTSDAYPGKANKGCWFAERRCQRRSLGANARRERIRNAEPQRIVVDNRDNE